MLDKKFVDIGENVKNIKIGKMIIYNIDPDYFKDNNSLPLARIKKIMKLDDEVKVNNINIILDDSRRNAYSILKSL